MRAYIKKLLREALDGETIFRDVTNIPDYDKLKAGKYDEIPSRYSNMVAYVKHMSPEDYLRECANIQGTTYEQQLKYISADNVSKLIGLVESGIKLYIPYLNYYDDLQEGRHRAKAAMEMGVDVIPVLIIDDKGEVDGYSDDEVNWEDVVEVGGNKYVKFDIDITDWKSISRLLMAITVDYDDYLLDYSFKHWYRGYNIDSMLEVVLLYRGVKEWMKRENLDEVGAIKILRGIVKYNAGLLADIIYRLDDNVVGLKISGIDSDYSSGYDMLVGERYYSDIKFKSYKIKR